MNDVSALCGRRVVVCRSYVTMGGLHAPCGTAPDEHGGRDAQDRRDSLDKPTTSGIEVRHRGHRVDEDTKLLEVVWQEEADLYHGDFTARTPDFSSLTVGLFSAAFSDSHCRRSSCTSVCTLHEAPQISVGYRTNLSRASNA